MNKIIKIKSIYHKMQGKKYGRVCLTTNKNVTYKFCIICNIFQLLKMYNIVISSSKYSLLY